jgi:hypothetical protein
MPDHNLDDGGMTILSLCDYSGNWSRPYEEDGYRVLRVDLQRGQDVRLLRRIDEPIRGILAAPPCTHFARSGAWKWAEKGEAAILEGLAIVDACLRAVAIHRPEWWALENPIGRLRDYLGPPAFRFDPCDFGDPWTKRTWLWGHFTPPMPLFCPSAISVKPALGDITTRKSGRDRNGRSETPPGFARAFFEANP